jgi:DNA invertase Pin-like site-specific DNA recombinase
MSENATPIRCGIYLRVSLDATGEHLAVSRQREDCQRIAAERGWTIVDEYVDNSISASDRRKDRPAYNRLSRAFDDGEFDALICWDLDRLTRQPRQLEDWIDAAAARGLLLVTANGEADLSTDGGRLFARIKASVARAEVERKSARQQRAALQRAERGSPPGGPRLTGYAADGSLDPDEARMVAAVFDRFHAGDSLRGITAWLAETAVPPRNGRSWNPSSVRTMLTNPRYAGRAVYRGASNGQAGSWEPIVDDSVFDAVQVKLSDPRRRTQVGTDRKHLGSGLYLCGVTACGLTVRSHSGGRYRCPAGGHITRLAASIDDFVLGVLRERLSRPDLADALTPPDTDEARSAAGEVKRLRGRLAKIEADYDAELIDGRRFKIATEKVLATLKAAELTRARAAAGSGVAATLASADPVRAFDDAPLGIQRAVLDFFMTVRLLPAERGHKFDPGTVKIDWRGGTQ